MATSSHQNLTVATSITTNHRWTNPRSSPLGVNISEARGIHPFPPLGRFHPWEGPPQCDKTSMRSSVILSPSPGCVAHDDRVRVNQPESYGKCLGKPITLDLCLTKKRAEMWRFQSSNQKRWLLWSTLWKRQESLGPTRYCNWNAKTKLGQNHLKIFELWWYSWFMYIASMYSRTIVGGSWFGSLSFKFICGVDIYIYVH